MSDEFREKICKKSGIFKTNVWFLELELLNASNNVISLFGAFSRMPECLQLLLL